MKRIKRGTPRHDEPWTWLALRVVNGAFRGMTPVFGQVLELGEGQIAMLMSATILGCAVLRRPFGNLSEPLVMAMYTGADPAPELELPDPKE